VRVVEVAFVFIAEDFIGSCDFLELGFGFLALVFRCLVGVVSEGSLCIQVSDPLYTYSSRSAVCGGQEIVLGKVILTLRYAFLISSPVAVRSTDRSSVYPRLLALISSFCDVTASAGEFVWIDIP
jgi:hypothetical protein